MSRFVPLIRFVRKGFSGLLKRSDSIERVVYESDVASLHYHVVCVWEYRTRDKTPTHKALLTTDLLDYALQIHRYFVLRIITLFTLRQR